MRNIKTPQNHTNSDFTMHDMMSSLWRHATTRAKQLAVVDEQGELSYTDLVATLELQMNLFRDEGIGEGDAVVVLLDVCIESVVAYWALHGVGAVLIVGDPSGTQDDVDHYLRVSGANHVMAGRSTSSSIRFPKWVNCWKCADRDSTNAPFGWYLDSASGFSSNPIVIELPDKIALILFSSGTTSTPKAIAHSREAVQALHETLKKTWGLAASDVVLGALPFHTIYGLVFSAASSLYAGSTLILQERFHPEHALSAIEQHKITTAAFVPAMIIMMLNLIGKERYNCSSLRMVYSASAPISESIIERFVAFSNAPVLCNYGMTEIPGAAVEVAGKPHEIGGVGLISPDFEVSIRDEHDRVLPAGEVGEITMRGPTLMLEYLGQPDKTLERVRDGWIYSQDRGYMDMLGNIFVQGRTSEMIIRGGLNISPQEVESVLANHESVNDAAVVGPKDDVLGQIVSAFVVPQSGPDDSEIDDSIKQYCRDNLAPAKVPAEINLIDMIPRNAGGKIDRAALLAVRAQRSSPSTYGE